MAIPSLKNLIKGQVFFKNWEFHVLAFCWEFLVGISKYELKFINNAI
jgi:hypothetical protein